MKSLDRGPSPSTDAPSRCLSIHLPHLLPRPSRSGGGHRRGAARARHDFLRGAEPLPDAARTERFALLPARAGFPAGWMTKPAILPPSGCLQPRPPRRATASKANALFGVVDETGLLPFGGGTGPARPASLHRGPCQRPDEPSRQLMSHARYNFLC